MSPSSQRAFEWAATRAATRSPASEQDDTPLVTAVDLLIGILLSHRERAKPSELLKYFQIPMSALYATIASTGGFLPEDAPNRPERLSDTPLLDDEVTKSLDTSQQLALKYNRWQDEVIHLPHLFGGLLTTPNKAAAGLHQALANIPTPWKSLLDSYPQYLISASKSYTEFLAEKFPLPPDYTPTTAIRFTVSGFSADTSSERDLIGIGAEVDAFAYLIAAKGLEPPLAIGLFGDWGSGKSYFMEALRHRIHKITADARNSKTPQKEISIYKHIAQIEFNAWHYVEGELWASLVDHIFHNLQTRSEKEPTLLEQRQQYWIEKLETARQAQRAAQAHKESLEENLSSLKEKIADLEAARDDALEELNNLKTRDVMEAVVLEKEHKENINNTLRQFGVTQTYDSALELKNAVDEVHAAFLRGNALTTPLRERGWRWTIGLILVAFIGPALSFVLSFAPDEVPGVTNALLGFSAFLSGLTVAFKRGTQRLATAVTKLEKAQNKLETEQRKVEQQFAAEITAAETALAKAEAAFEGVKSEEKALVEEIAQIELELQQITPGRVLFDFIKERVGSQDYRKHLGIAALIRRDFNQLSGLIAEQNAEFIKNDDGAQSDSRQHIVNRIVLYIDDLDRCPPDRVVEVLQAVHLLLAFPLFVVVVAVDARWLSQSLQSHYKELLIPNKQYDFQDFSRQASPQDYLEKIFQVPFWIRPLTPGARKRIIQGLVKNSLVIQKPANKGAGASDKKSESSDQKRTETRSEDRALIHWDPGIRPINPEIKTDLKPESLDIQEIELQFMEALRSILGETPRAVKRFVNVYRLIKAISLNSTPEFVTNRSDADFKCVLFLLAILTGLPTISRQVLQLIREKSTFSQPPEDDPASSQFTLNDLIRDLQALPLSDLEAKQDAARLEKWLSQYDEGRWQTLETNKFVEWIPQVVRYSYRIEE